MPTTHSIDEIYGDTYFEGGGAGYTDYLAEERLLHQRGQFYARRAAARIKPGRLLDVGAAAGCFLQGWIDAGWQGEGIEPNSKMANLGAERYGLKIQCSSLEAYQTDQQFDLVCLSQVIAHFKNPNEVANKVHSLLRSGGICLIETWDRSSIMASLQGEGWHEYSPPSVLHWFSRAGLSELFTRHGFRNVAQGKIIKWIGVGHARSLVQHTGNQSRTDQMIAGVLGMLPENLALPYPSEDLFWAMFRKG
jgi:SAM-dependent methyltransferase